MIPVTGATGHVERAVVCRLASLGHDVVAMVRDLLAASRGLPSGIALLVADYEDACALKRALAGIDDMVLISSDGDASAVMHRHRVSYGGQYYFHGHRRYRRVVAILLLTERNLLAFVERAPACALDGADVDEHVVAAVVRLYEAEALCRVEPLSCSGSHFNFSKMRKCAVPARPSYELNPISAMSWGVEPVRRDQQGKRLFEWQAPLCLR